MSEDVKICPSCGEQSRDLQWCETCGTRLDEPEEGEAKWLERSETLELLSADEHRLKIKVTDAVDTFATRRVMFANIVDGPDELIGRRVLLEERDSEQEDLENRIPEGLRGLFRTPLAVGRNGPHSVRCYEDTGAVTLEDLLDLSGDLSYQQVKETFLAILDAVLAAHEAEHLILAIAPWTLRLENIRIPDTEGDATHLIFDRDDATHEHQRVELSDVATIEGLPDSLEDATQPADDTDQLLSTVMDEPTQEMATLSGNTLPGHKILEDGEEAEPADRADTSEHEVQLDFESDDSDGESDSLDEPSDEEYVSAPEEEPNVDDLWGSLDDESDVLPDTGILHGGAAALLSAPDAKAFFEGIDEVFPFEAEPYEVPVIMGFSPPELLGRVRADLGPHCDIFALGMLLYYMIAGRVPPASVYTRYAPALPVRNFRPGFPPGLQPIISRATRPTPEDRFTSVLAMREAFINACTMMERRARAVTGGDVPRTVLAVDTHVGIAKGRRNPTNQDSVFGQVSDDGRFALIVVADGVSTASYGSGDLASHYLRDAAEAVWDEVLPKYLMDERIEEVDIITSILETANDAIVAHVNEHHTPFSGNPHEVMGTTALVAVVREGIVTLASLGDSRVYIQTPNGLEQVTADHNLWTLSVLDGISADAALSMPHGDALARCLGTFMIEDRQLTAVRPEADYFRFALARGDTLLLTTDGLIDFAGSNPFAAEENILSAMLAEPDPALACLELILLANRGGGGDNIGVGIAHFV